MFFFFCSCNYCGSVHLNLAIDRQTQTVVCRLQYYNDTNWLSQSIMWPRTPLSGALGSLAFSLSLCIFWNWIQDAALFRFFCVNRFNHFHCPPITCSPSVGQCPFALPWDSECGSACPANYFRRQSRGTCLWPFWISRQLHLPPGQSPTTTGRV